MVAERKAIDLESIEDSDALASELELHPEGIVIRRGGKRVGVLSTLSDRDATPDESSSDLDTFVADSDEEQTELSGPVVEDDWYERWQWSRRFDIGLVDIGGAIGPMPRFTFTPERLNRILDIIAFIKDLDADDMRRIIEESLRQRGTGHGARRERTGS